MQDHVSLACFALAALGLAALALQLLLVRAHVRAGPQAPGWRPKISILKPLCGLDDGLEENLATFARLDYPESATGSRCSPWDASQYELLLGVRNRLDSAYPVAAAAAARWPGRVRVVEQEGEPGLNPKVNQLITLLAHARHEVILVSDSNVRVPPEHLEEIAACLNDPGVGIVTYPIVAGGERRLGSVLDGLHLAAHIGPGVIAAKRFAGADIVVGKTMAMRRRDLVALGGFASVKDVLAEDYVLGQRTVRELKKTVALAHRPVVNVSKNGGLGDFLGRYLRWSVIHRKMVSPAAYLGELLLNPILLATLGALAAPSRASALLLAAVSVLKIAVDTTTARALRGRSFPLWSLPLIPAKDLFIGVVWGIGLMKNTVEWRGNRLRVLAGTRLVPEDAPAVPLPRRHHLQLHPVGLEEAHPVLGRRLAPP